MSTATLIATFDEYGEVLAYVIVPGVGQEEVVHSNSDHDPIRTYAVELETDEYDHASDNVQDALDLVAQVHAIDAKNRSRA